MTFDDKNAETGSGSSRLDHEPARAVCNCVYGRCGASCSPRASFRLDIAANRAI